MPEQFIRYRHTIEHMLYLANGRRFILWCDTYMRDFLYPDLVAMNVDIDCFVSDTMEEAEYDGKKIIKSIDLFYEEKEDVFVYVSLLSGHSNAYKKLVGMGFKYGSKLGSDFYIGALCGGFEDIDILDHLLGTNRFYGDVLGFKIYGNPDNADIKIMTLGGSTTDPTVGWNKTWPEALYDILSVAGRRPCIFNGGIIGYTATQMFLKFLRDGLSYNPDVVITFDGLNDTRGACCDPEYPFLQKYQRRLFDHIQEIDGFAPDTLGIMGLDRMVYGTPAEEMTDEERYIRVHRWFHAICSEYGIRYYGFFQPVFETGSSLMDEREASLRASIGDNDHLTYSCSTRENFTKAVSDWVAQTDYMFDLCHIFDGKYHMYYDFYHSSDEGHKMIADNIYDLVFKGLQ